MYQMVWRVLSALVCVSLLLFSLTFRVAPHGDPRGFTVVH